MVARRFGENLARQRKLAAMSQEDLATGASLHRTEISQLERGLRLARIDTVIKLAATLEIGVEDLLDGISWTPGTTQYGRFRETER